LITSSTPEFQTTDSEDRSSTLRRVLAVVCALTVTAGILFGYSYLSWRNSERLRLQQAAEVPAQKPSPSPQAVVFVDEAMIKGPQAVIGGTVQNISPAKYTNLKVEIELKRRKDGGVETRMLDLVPSEVEPEQQGRYSLNVPSREYRESKVLSIRSGEGFTFVPFKTMPGASRPKERLPESKTIIIKPSPRRGNGEEFINTPETPVKIP